jgi:flagellar protein FlgJ
VLKSMRDATPKGGMFDSDESRMYQSLLDQQMAMQLATRSGGIGLAKVIERQLGGNGAAGDAAGGRVPLDASIRRGFDAAARRRQGGGQRQILPHLPARPQRLPRPLPNMPAGAGPRAFVEKVWPQAVEASRATGIPARFLVAQAALETGWGKYELKNADGSPSHNLFNIKAGKRWAATR